MSKAILELNLKRDRLVNDGNTGPVGSQEPREQSATELVRAEHARGREEDTSVTTEESLPSTTSSHKYRLITATMVTKKPNPNRMYFHVITKVSSCNHKVSSSNSIVPIRYSRSASNLEQLEIKVISNQTIMSSRGQAARWPLG
jgi:hypothetical protein